jgi:putative endonuclease
MFGRTIRLKRIVLARCHLSSVSARGGPAKSEKGWGRVKIMYTVYVLKSLRNDKRYVGYTSKTVEVRLKEHNSGSNKFTSQNGPFTLIYTEDYETKTDAIRREKFLKSGKGRKFLDSLPK